jgi:tripartite-type tricarboxylate transporter receptor subunit TctC
MILLFYKNYVKKLAVWLILASTPVAVHAWQPTKPVNVVIAYGPGSGNEILFRKAAQIVSKNHPVTFVLDFKPGANELVGINHFALASADGYTLYSPGMGVWFATAVWYKSQMNQNPTDWETVVSLAEAPIALFASTASTVNNPNQFYNTMKSGKAINVGVGAPVMALAYEYMAKETKSTNSQRIMYNSPAAVAQAVASNQVEFGIAPLSVANELAKAGKLKVIGITGTRNFNDYPNLSTAFKGLTMVAHAGLVLPKNTPKPVVDYYQSVFTEAIATQEYQDFLKSITWYDSLKTPLNYKLFIDAQRKQWIPVAESVPFN